MDIKRLDVSVSGIVRVRKYHVYVKWKKKGQSSLMTTVLKKSDIAIMQTQESIY